MDFFPFVHGLPLFAVTVPAASAVNNNYIYPRAKGLQYKCTANVCFKTAFSVIVLTFFFFLFFPPRDSS